MNAKDIVEAETTRTPPPTQVEASRIYELALKEHPDWWESYNQFDWICDEYKVNPDSDIAESLYEAIYAGLT